MQNNKLLQYIFNGYVNCYRKNNWHTTSNYSDVTQAELNFFLELGQRLGFIVRREMNWQYPRDLCWCETTQSEAFLYLERENLDSRCLQTIEKQLNPDNIANIELLVSVFGWVKPATLSQAKQLIRNNLPANKHILLISWVGEDRDAEDTFIEAWIYFNSQELKRIATLELDKAGYWYMYFSDSSQWT